MVVVGLWKEYGGLRSAAHYQFFIGSSFSEPSLLLMDFLLTMRETAMNGTYFGGRMELNTHNLVHLIVSRAAIPARGGCRRTVQGSARSLSFVFLRSPTDGPPGERHFHGWMSRPDLNLSPLSPLELRP
jgi:hypothetical protein